ncbi:MAG: hypothetical protein CVU54_18445 [Deltaproteobacteria bacterium HGW-Deltaproteobacteria-12]|nr:MAG: hypothetical protein CVU54_18445 [Deltaproteobacteria bacterium HGW-Deltaproteobacteria-12]
MKINNLRAVLTCLLLAMMLSICVPGSGFCGSLKDQEENALLQAARHFLDAEVRRDYPAVYACFASASAYARSHSYEEYLAQVKALPYRIVGYRIVTVSYIQENNEKIKYPAVERVAQVEVELKFLHADTQDLTEINIGFHYCPE